MIRYIFAGSASLTRADVLSGFALGWFFSAGLIAWGVLTFVAMLVIGALIQSRIDTMDGRTS